MCYCLVLAEVEFRKLYLRKCGKVLPTDVTVSIVVQEVGEEMRKLVTLYGSQSSSAITFTELVDSGQTLVAREAAHPSS